jgi:molybdopterin/thiamine biosynthesis adenylyltransferase
LQGTHGAIHVTDDDRIELSNLSRQFLFRHKDVHSAKATCASKAAIVRCVCCTLFWL